MYIPHWGGDPAPIGAMDLDVLDSQSLEQSWTLDPLIASTPSIYPNYSQIKSRFRYTATVLQAINDRYQVSCKKIEYGRDAGFVESQEIWRHAMVLAHIASKRTDDPKVGVGAIVVSSSSKYVAVGWNGFPRKVCQYVMIQRFGMFREWTSLWGLSNLD